MTQLIDVVSNRGAAEALFSFLEPNSAAKLGATSHAHHDVWKKYYPAKKVEDLVYYIAHNAAFCLDSLPESYIHNKEVVVKSVHANVKNFFSAPKELQNDSLIIKLALCAARSSPPTLLPQGFLKRVVCSSLTGIKRPTAAFLEKSDQAKILATLPKEIKERADIKPFLEAFPRIVDQSNGSVEYWADHNCIDIVLEMIHNDALAFSFLIQLRPSYQTDVDFCAAALKQNGLVLQFFEEPLKSDPRMISLALEENPLALEFAGALRDDFDTVLKAVRRNGNAIRDASPRLQRDPVIIREALFQDGSALWWLDASIKADEEFVLLAATQNERALRSASRDLLSSVPFARKLLSRNGLTLQYFSPEVRERRGLVLVAVRQNWRVLEFAGPEWKADPEIIAEAMNQNPAALRLTSNSFKFNRKNLADAVRRMLAISEGTDEEILSNRLNMLRVVCEDGMMLECLDDKWKADKGIVHAAVSQNGHSLKFTCDKLRRDDDMILTAMKQDSLFVVHANGQESFEKSFYWTNVGYILRNIKQRSSV